MNSEIITILVHSWEKKYDEYVAATGHYGNKSHKLVKDYATDLGYEYLSASNKDEFLAVVDKFLSSEKNENPILFELSNREIEFSLISNGDNFVQNDIIIGILSIYYKMPFPFPQFMKMDKAELAKFTGT